jgi:Terminase large subunit, ATPase domain
MVAIIMQVEWLGTRIDPPALEGARGYRRRRNRLGLCRAVGGCRDQARSKPQLWVYDELGQSPDRKLFDVLDTAMGARDQPLGLVISTQAARDDAPMSELVDYGLRCQRKEITDPTFHLELRSLRSPQLLL